MGREVGRCRNVVNYMLTYATKDQKLFLSSKPPSTEKVGEDWTLWSNKLQEIGRSIMIVTMAGLAAEEAKLFGDKKVKSKAGAKITATISAVDKRLTTLKSGRDKTSSKSATSSSFTAVASSNSKEAPSTPADEKTTTSSSSSSSKVSCAAAKSPTTPSRALKRQRKDEITTTV